MTHHLFLVAKPNYTESVQSLKNPFNQVHPLKCQFQHAVSDHLPGYQVAPV